MAKKREKGRRSKKYARERAARDERNVDPQLVTRTAEALLVETIGELKGERVVCKTLGRAQFAAVYAAANPDASVTCQFLDVHLSQRAENEGRLPESVTVACTADLPEGEFDLAAFPFTKNGEAELTRETMQTAHQRLVDGGRMVVAVDVADDEWLHDEMRTLFDKVTRCPEKRGVVYLATKKGPLKRTRSFDCEFAFRDDDRLVKAFTRPGVFSHRRLDLGARALLEAVAVEQGDRVLDLGSGAGAIGTALALRAPDVSVLAVDSNPRALQCVERAAALNELTTVRTLLTADAGIDELNSFDLVVANPPYFSNFAIAGIFLDGAERAVRPGGCVAFVTRQPEWFVERMEERFDEVQVAAVRSYFVVAGIGRD